MNLEIEKRYRLRLREADMKQGVILPPHDVDRCLTGL